jgi:hypothetical protein
MSIFRLFRKQWIPDAGIVARMSGKDRNVRMEKSGSDLETCIVSPHVQILDLFEVLGMLHNNLALSTFCFNTPVSHVNIASLKIVEGSYRVRQGYRTLVKEERGKRPGRQPDGPVNFIELISPKGARNA